MVLSEVLISPFKELISHCGSVILAAVTLTDRQTLNPVWQKSFSTDLWVSLSVVDTDRVVSILRTLQNLTGLVQA